MAYLDNNNDHLTPMGDPLGDLDRELEELRSALGALEEDPPAPKAEETGDKPEPEPSLPPQSEIPADESEDEKEPEDDKDMKKNNEYRPTRYAAKGGKLAGVKPRKRDKPKKKSRLPVILIAILLASALVIGGIALYHHYNSIPFFAYFFRSDKDTDTLSDGKTVSISDSVMGDIEITPVEGAKINTYTKENLKYDENGYPEYYENGEKISHLGADLSEFQGDVDFEAMKNAGIEFVMLRIGGRSYGEEGSLYADSAFLSNYQKAKDAGLKVGAYFFSQAVSVADAKEEANYALSQLGDKKLDYPLALDWENIADDSARTDTVSGDMLTTIAETFCDTVTAAGYKSLVYSNTQQMFIMYDFETMKDYDFWLADYRDFPNMYYKFDMWQYTTEGTIDGVDGTLDLNISFTDFTD